MEDQSRLRCEQCAEAVVPFTNKAGKKRYHHDYTAIGTKIRLMRPERVSDPLRLMYELVCDMPVLSRATAGSYDGRGEAAFNRIKRRNALKAINTAMLRYFCEERAEDPDVGWGDIRHQ